MQNSDKLLNRASQRELWLKKGKQQSPDSKKGSNTLISTSANISQNYEKAKRREDNFCDLKIDCNPPILCHKEVLSSSSKVINQMINLPFKESLTSTISFDAQYDEQNQQPFDRQIILAFVQFCYKGGRGATIKSTLIPQLLYFAQIYGVTRLMIALEEELIQGLSKFYQFQIIIKIIGQKLFENTIMLAQQANLIRVEAKCVEWGRKNIQLLKTYGVLKRIDKQTLRHLNVTQSKKADAFKPLPFSY